MAKKQASGSALTQRERKQLSREKTNASNVEAEENADTDVDAKNLEISKKIDAEMPRLPHERIMVWIYHFYNNHLSPNIFLELGILAVTAQQSYLAFFPEYLADEADFNLCISSLCGLLGNFFAFFVIFKSRDTLPPWNTIYLLFLPLLLSFVFNKDLLLYNTAFTMASLDLPIIARFFIQFTVIGSNSEYGKEPLNNARLIAAHLIINYVLGQISELKSWDKIENNLFSILIIDLYLVKSDSVHILVLQRLLTSFALGLLIVYTINLILKGKNIARSVLIIILWPAVFAYSSFYFLNPLLGENALFWLYNFITASETRIKILSVWLASLLFLIPTIFNYKISLSANFRRKIWHFIILLLLVYPLYLDKEFVQFSLSGALILFFIIELVRYSNLYPLGQYLDQNLRHFADFRDDKGPIIISYIYLLIGISIPILINGSPIGLVVLGVGDSMASIVGQKYGLINWSNSKKTVEGTFAFIVSTFAICSGLKYFDFFFLNKSYHALLLTCTLSGILEGSSDMNDNIMIPGFMLVLLESII